jgi:hypothetical protein
MEQHTATRRWTDSGFDLLSPETTLDFRLVRYGREMKLGAHIDPAHSISIDRLGEKYYLMIVITYPKYEI